MSRPVRVAIASAVAALLLLSSVAPAGAADTTVAEEGAPSRTARKVLVFTMPTVRWSDVVEHRPPALLELLERSAIASMSVRTIGSASTLGRAYATISAGNRAMVNEVTAGHAFEPGEELESSEAADVLGRRCLCETDDAAAVHVAAPEITGINRRQDFGAVPGALAAALADNGLSIGVVGNADGDIDGDVEAAHREVGLAGMDTEGRISAGSVGSDLLTEDPDAPFGVRTDIDATTAAFVETWDEADVVVLEASDLERVDRYAGVAAPEAVEAAQADAMASADELLAAALEHVDLEQDLVLVVAPTEPRPLPVELAMGAIAGVGVEPGLATSATTRRPGYLTLPAVASTSLRALGVDVPSTMQGGAISSTGGGAPTIEMVEELAGDNDLAVFRNAASGPISVIFVILQVVTYLLAAVAVVTRRRRLQGPVRIMALTIIALPSVAFLSGLFPYDELGAAGYSVLFFVAGLVLALLVYAVADRLRRRVSPRVGPLIAPLTLIALIYLTLVVDIVAGARLQIDTVFGYGGGAIVAGRFAGYGNVAYALVTISAIVLGCALWGVASLRGGAASTASGRSRAALVGVGVLFLFTTAMLGLPWFGINIGATLSSVPAFILTVLLLAGVSISLRRVALITGATLLVISVFGAFDLSRPEQSRTHLGRFITLVADQGLPGFLTVIERKLAANVNILTSSMWTLLVPVGLVFLAVLVWREPEILRAVHRRFPGARSALIGGLVAATLGGLLNDSGVAIPAMMFAILLPFVTVLVAAIVEEDTPVEEAEPAPLPVP